MIRVRLSELAPTFLGFQWARLGVQSMVRIDRDQPASGLAAEPKDARGRARAGKVAVCRQHWD